MRLLNLYIVYDVKAKTIIGPVVHDQSPVPIVRNITEAVNADRGIIAKNPEDFVILHIGMIDDETGDLHDIGGDNLHVEKEIVAQALALRARSS